MYEARNKYHPSASFHPLRPYHACLALPAALGYVDHLRDRAGVKAPTAILVEFTRMHYLWEKYRPPA